MPQLGNPASIQARVASQSDELFQAAKLANCKKTDRLFAGLLAFEWIAGIIVAVVVSPRTWAASHSDVHIHVWTAIILGGLVVAQPIALAITRPGQTLTRHVIAVGQMLWSALLIHLMGGRIEAHFGIFGSLAFLSFYRDWRVLISASLVVVIDHFVRGLYFPFSIYGISTVQSWRWLEHTWWVVFEDIFLIRACLANIDEMQAIAFRQASLEETRANIENLVAERTEALSASERRMAAQYEVTRIIAESHSVAQSMPKILESIARAVVPSEFSCLVIFSGLTGESQVEPGQSRQEAESEAERVKNDLSLSVSSSSSTSSSTSTSSGSEEITQDNIDAVGSPAKNGMLSVHSKAGASSSQNSHQYELDADSSSTSDSGNFRGNDEAKEQALPIISSTRTLTAPIVYQRWTEPRENDGPSASEQGLTDPGRPGLNHAYSLLIATEKRKHGLIQIYSEKPVELTDSEISMLESLGKQIGEFIDLRGAEQDIRHLANIVQSCNDAIIGLDLTGLITSWNNGAEKIFGFDESEMRGQHISLLVPLSFVDAIEEFLSSDFGVDKDMEFTSTAKSGKEIAVSLSVSTVTDNNGMLIGRSAIIHDITARQEAAKRVAEFYSIVSHELRTPLTSIRGVLGLLEGGIVDPGSEEARELVEVAASSTDRLIRLINDMLDIKKIEAGKMNFSMEKFDCTKLIEEGLEALKGFSAEQQVQLRSDLHYQGSIYADRDKTMQILTNLVSNALKFSTPGNEVIVSSEFHSNLVHISVRDFGPGISEENRLKLFTKFQQIDSSDSRQRGGTGLGLAISKALVERQNGKIGVDSSPGKGSSFWFELPAEKTAMVKNQEAAPNGKKILLVENDPNLSHLISQLLTKAGHAVSLVSNLKDARARFEQAPPEVVLLDLVLDDGNGLDLLQEIRANPRLRDTPVIVITAQSVEDNLQGRAMVFDWLVKPFDIQLLMEAIRRACGRKGQRALIVNEDAGERDDLMEQLQKMGVICIAADQCKKAVEIANKQKPDIIILDIKKANFETIKELSALHKDTRTNIPVLLYTSHKLSPQEKLEVSETIINPKGLQNAEELLSAVQSILQPRS